MKYVVIVDSRGNGDGAFISRVIVCWEDVKESLVAKASSHHPKRIVSLQQHLIIKIVNAGQVSFGPLFCLGAKLIQHFTLDEGIPCLTLCAPQPCLTLCAQRAALMKNDKILSYRAITRGFGRPLYRTGKGCVPHRNF